MKRILVVLVLLGLGSLAVYGVREAREGMPAIGWGFVLLVCCAVLLGIGGTVASRLGGKWELAGSFAVFAAFSGAVFGAFDLVLRLHAREDRVGPAWGMAAAALEWILLVPSALIVLVGLGAALIGLSKGDDDPLPSLEPVTGSSQREECDVVMKGGITSGIVYPRAIARLAQKYNFVNVGGASAGAIAAAATAAAAYARANGRDGFAVLEKLPDWLGRHGRLFKLFRPNPSTRAPFEVFVAFLGHVPLPFKLARALAVGAWHFPIAFTLGLLPAWFLGSNALATSAPAWGVTGAMLVGLIGAPLAIIAGFVLTLCFALPRNLFGMCSGRIGARKDVLSTWLDGLLSHLSGVEGRPLTFADLWTAGERYETHDARREAARTRLARERKVNFEALTTSLVHGRPFRLPDIGGAFYFRKHDLARVLPETVVDWMVEHAQSSDQPVEPHTVPEDGDSKFFRLPEACDLPVVFAARLSLSFPLLISAVPLWGVDWRRPANRTREGDAPVTLDVCWMSDGGISSNFPIHFFDALIPSRPTFGLNLAPFHENAKRQADENRNVFLPKGNLQGISETWQHFKGLGGFVGALVNSLQAFLDNMQAHSPGFRDRIARIYLDKAEGGMNLTMPADVLERLGARGAAAGDRIVARFVNETPSGWDNHRWVRLRLLLGRLDPLLRDLATKQLPSLDDPPSYEWRNSSQRELAERVLEHLVAIGREIEASPANLQDGEPRPRPELRTSPRV